MYVKQKKMGIKIGDQFDLVEIKKNGIDAKVGCQVISLGNHNGFINTIGESAYSNLNFHPMLTALFRPEELKKIGTFKIKSIK